LVIKGNEDRANNVELATGKYEEVVYVFVDSMSKLSMAIELATRPLNKKLDVESKEKLINDVIQRELLEIAKEQQKLTEIEIMIIKVTERLIFLMRFVG
jgi:ribosomal protein L7Ae-like RNA K-turn-binding protein